MEILICDKSSVLHGYMNIGFTTKFAWNCMEILIIDKSSVLHGYMKIGFTIKFAWKYYITNRQFCMDIIIYHQICMEMHGNTNM